jgi:hypothetical protein
MQKSVDIGRFGAIMEEIAKLTTESSRGRGEPLESCGGWKRGGKQTGEWIQEGGKNGQRGLVMPDGVAARYCGRRMIVRMRRMLCINLGGTAEV